MRRAGRGRRRDAGQATVLTLAGVVVLLGLTLGGLEVTRAITLAHRARSAADLSALAAARVVAVGWDVRSACARAVLVAGANGARVSACAWAADGSVAVTVAVDSARPWSRTAVSTARAGPG